MEKMLGDVFELSFEELDTRHDHHDPAEMWELSARATARRTCSGTRSTRRAGASWTRR